MANNNRFMYQNLGNGVFQVIGATQRSAVTGRYVRNAVTSKSPSEPVYRVGSKVSEQQKPSGPSSK